MHFSAMYILRWWGGKNKLFRAKCVNISKTARDTSKVTISG